MDKTVLICLSLIVFITTTFLIVLLADYVRIRKGKSSFLLDGERLNRYSIVHTIKGYRFVYKSGLTYEQAKQVQKTLSFYTTIEKE